MKKLSIEEELEILKSNVVEIIPENGLEEKLRKAKEEKRPLRIKLGADPSAPDLHLGHAVVLKKLKQFQDLGHQVVFIIGDFTGRIGDPSGRSETRKPLTPEQVKKNAITYQEQVGKILDISKAEIRYQEEWFGKMMLEDMLVLTSKYTIARMLERDDFALRFKEQRPIFLHEIMYPLLQAYDSVAIKADIELGGTDQKFNLIVGREIQREYGMEPQVAMLMPILEGLDGKQKMSKSLGNYIGLTEPPNQMYGKVMSIPDELIIRYFELATEVSKEEIRKIEKEMKEGILNPRDAKARLAKEIVKIYHGEKAGIEAEEEFNRIFSNKELPEKVEEVLIKDTNKIWVVKLLTLTGAAKTNSEAKRLISQGAVEIDGVKIEDINLDIELSKPFILRVGKHFFRRVIKG
ncbi:MAG TPA: tyrosine--tRNA ligase [Dictyoglomaceae bacterium]|nr:tyrosine--tRNA ligase [Dictyoglomaceae bacterium]HOL39132.1 tyrosine--tRNA ligase [Dictyoglomaceae bacterium]HPP15286.1 tyrosine--tRNA ligase [Dictyoglomaceae bacterium]HPU42692.1 tyrosine--tRNA ligase [Dictyoglomaceae bacterium]